jgi:hypothetical protein
MAPYYLIQFIAYKTILKTDHGIFIEIKKYRKTDFE